jgi:ligand-binding SRPBCC domain-containing protein
MISFKSHSGIHTLKSEQEIPISIEKAWDYFSTPKNLANITTPEMGFIITSETEDKVYEGQIISYNVGIILGIRTSWVTEITKVKEQHYFVDEQRFGPYSMWHHEHFFEALPNGNTLVKDKISYKIPLGFLGQMMNGILIKKQLNHIFSYRTAQLKTLFPS